MCCASASTSPVTDPPRPPVLVTRGADEPVGPAGLAARIHAHPALLGEALRATGALLFRGFGLDTDDAFAAALDALGIARLPYVAGNSPRTELGRGVFTSTEYSASQTISLHNELSYSAPWPRRLFMGCMRPADTGGATTVADGRRVLARLSPATAAEFAERRVRYVRNLHGGRGMGRSWQATFATDDRAAVERACRAAASAWTWTDSGLRLVHTGPGVVTHPATEERVWFNQAEQFHPTSLPAEVAAFLMDEYRGREDELPQWVSFADGGHIPAATLEEIRAALAQETAQTPWRAGDLLVIDNVLALHGRMPFTGARRVLIAMD